MAQGKEFTEKQREEIIQSLEEYLKLGYSRNKACELVGFKPTTLSEWVVKDEGLRIKLQGYENYVNVKARANIVKTIEGGDVPQSNWWAERKMKGEFSTRTEQTGADGKDLIPSEEHTKKSQDAINDYLNK